MEEKKNLTAELTAERSLEIIRESIEQSRRTVSETTGKALYVSGTATMAMAVVVAIVNFIFQTPMGHLLWMVLPIVIWLLMRNIRKAHVHEPASLVGTLVGKTWWTFAVFAIVFFIIAVAWSMISARLYEPEVYMAMQIHVAPTIALLMGMAVTMTGHILKQRWLIIFGIVAGLGTFLLEHLGVGQALLIRVAHLSPSQFVVSHAMLPCLTYFLFALVGLVLPGFLIKSK